MQVAAVSARGQAGKMRLAGQFGLVAKLIGVAALYLTVATLSLRFASINPSATPIWPPTGLALGLILLMGYRVWPAILVGAIVTNYPTTGWLSLAIGCGNTLEALVGVWLLRTFAGGVEAFRTPPGIAKFAIIMCGLATPISATIGVIALALSGRVTGSGFPDVWMTWWLGDLAGGLVVAPALVLWVIEPPQLKRPFRPLIESVALVALATAVGFLAFGPGASATAAEVWPFLTLMPLLWGALRGGERDTASAVVILSGFAVWGITAGAGPFIRPTLNESFLLLVAFMVSIALPSLALSTGMASRGRALAASEETYHQLVDAIRDQAIFVVGTDGCVATWNSAAARIYGYTAAQVIGQPVARLSPPEDNVGMSLEEAAETGRSEVEGWRIRRDGDRFWAHVVMSPIRDERGVLVGFAMTTRDVTEQREAQGELERTREQLLQSQKLEALGQLTGGVAHDFNNLLMVVGGQADLLARKLQNKTELKSLDAIKGAAARGAALTRQLLSFAGRRTLAPQVIELGSHLKQMRAVLQSSLGEAIELELALPEEGSPIKADPHELELALLNLAVNARDAMPEGGRVRIEVRNVSGASDDRSPDLVELSFSDTGQGMTPEVLERAFDPFFTTKPVGKGTGLGLSQVHGFALQAGGEASVKSRPGEGSTVTVRFPRTEAVAVSEFTSKTQAPALPACRVLLVEDNIEVADVTSMLLERLGCTSVRADTAAAALRILAQGERFGVVLSDIVMPGPIDGLALAERIGENYPHIPVVLASGYTQPSARLPPGVQVLQKPYDLDDLAAALHSALGRANGAIASPPHNH
jgi:PAS domain S-box-containing protein